MSKVLFVKANDRNELGVSVKMYNSFLDSYREANPNDQIIEVDLFNLDLPYYGNTGINAMYKKSNSIPLDTNEQSIVTIIEKHIQNFQQADKIVFAFPLWNFTVPAPLITYVSYLSQAGITFNYTENGPVGLVNGKKVALLFASGGVYSTGPASSAEMGLNYMKTVMNFWGIKDVTTVVIEGHNQFADRATQIIEEGLQKTSSVASQF